MIRIAELNKKFGSVEVLKNLDLEVKDGGISAILGPNGSGKTTLIKSILGMVVPDSGLIELDGKSVLRKYKYRDNINYLPQIANFPGNLNVKELIGMIRDLRQGASTEDKLISDFGLQPFLKQKLANLSGGTRQKVNLVLTFMFDSELIILDEPTSGLDPVAMVQLKSILREEREKGKTILICSHIMSFVQEVADDIVFLLDGKIYFQGTIDQIQKETGVVDLEQAIAKILRVNNA
jgi:Cu-processing system ATP-binding protein